MLEKDFYQIDVFTDTPLRGNPAAVVFDAEDIPAPVMQAIAREMNLSETVFVLEPSLPGADYRVRIFSPGSEFPFAGHPTLAAAYAVLKRGGLFPEGRTPGVLRQECGIGIVPVRIEGPEPVLTMTQGRPEYHPAKVSRSLLADMLGCALDDLAPGPIEVVSTGLPWLIGEVADRRVISSLKPDLGLIAKVCTDLVTPGVTVFCENPEGSAARLRLRTFAPVVGVAEDPVCGSGNGCVAAYLARHRHGDRTSFAYTAEQGVEIGRHGLVHVAGTRAGETWSIEVGGTAVKVLEGRISF